MVLNGCGPVRTEQLRTKLAESSSLLILLPCLKSTGV